MAATGAPAEGTEAQPALLKLMGISVPFPAGLRPFRPQVMLMRAALQAVLKRENALLEAPTGTGKTLALLSAVLAWRKHVMGQAGGGKKKPPRIYYACRTHSQIAQVVKELRRCAPLFDAAARAADGADDPPVGATVLGARKHYCTHRRVSKSATVDEDCKRLLESSSGCPLQRRSAAAAQAAPAVADVEDLIASARDRGGCAYFAARARAPTASIVFLPYAYLVSPGVRKAMDVSLQQAVVVVDEAHNLESVCREAASFEADVDDVSRAAEELRAAAAAGSSHTASLNALAGVLDSLSKCASGRAALGLERVGFGEERSVIPGPEFAAILGSECGVVPERVESLQDHLSKIQGPDGGPGSSASTSAAAAPGPALAVAAAFLSCTSFLLGDSMRNVPGFRAVLSRRRRVPQQGSRRAAAAATRPLQLCIWCLDPAVAMGPIQSQARSVLLASGTLSPLHAVSSELGVPFPHCVEAPHVIDPAKQLWLGTVGDHALDGDPSRRVSLEATYRASSSFEFQDALGDTVIGHAEAVPGGTLIFFPSYAALERATARWTATGLLARLRRSRTVVVEEKGAAGARGFARAVARYREHAATGEAAAVTAERNGSSRASLGGAVLFAVCRGRASEGIDFADACARLVIVVGIPYPSVGDLSVTLKRAHQDAAARRLSPGRPALSGSAWYSREAFCALSQAVGRCIRHAGDHGAVLLIDKRHERGTRQRLSHWLRGSLQVFPSTTESLASLRAFVGDQHARRRLAVEQQAAPTDTRAGGGKNVLQALLEHAAKGGRRRASRGSADGNTLDSVGDLDARGEDDPGPGPERDAHGRERGSDSRSHQCCDDPDIGGGDRQDCGAAGDADHGRANGQGPERASCAACAAPLLRRAQRGQSWAWLAGDGRGVAVRALSQSGDPLWCQLRRPPHGLPAAVLHLADDVVWASRALRVSDFPIRLLAAWGPQRRTFEVDLACMGCGRVIATAAAADGHLLATHPLRDQCSIEADVGVSNTEGQKGAQNEKEEEEEEEEDVDRFASTRRRRRVICPSAEHASSGGGQPAKARRLHRALEFEEEEAAVVSLSESTRAGETGSGRLGEGRKDDPKSPSAKSAAPLPPPSSFPLPPAVDDADDDEDFM